VSYIIIYIPTKSNSNEIESLIVIFIHLQLTLGCVVKRRRDHLHFLHDLLDDTTLAQKIVVSSVFPVTEIVAIENHKFYCTFLSVVFGSQSLLKLTSDQVGEKLELLIRWLKNMTDFHLQAFTHK
jgi:hypothetical protein